MRSHIAMRRNRIGRVVAPIAVLGALSVSILASPPPAGADSINGCEIVANPRVDFHTECVQANLSQEDLSSAVDLSYANFDHADLSRDHFTPGTSLTDANLTQANLSYSLVRNARLPEVILTNANLQNASFNTDDFSHADLYGANLTGVRFDDSNLSDANLADAVMDGTKFCNTTMPDGKVNNAGC